jgi:hypothetical protein
MALRISFVLALSVWSMGCADDGSSLTTTSTDPATCSCPLSIQVDNLAVCAAESRMNVPPRVYSSMDAAGKATCEDDDAKFPHPVPSAAWTTLRISSPCSGKGKVCFSLRHGDAKAPKESDCVLAHECVDFDYEASDGGSHELSAMPGWTVTDGNCALLYEAEGGYIEFHPEDAEVGCADGLNGSLRTQTCPVHCGKHPSGPGCDKCSDEPVSDSI